MTIQQVRNVQERVSEAEWERRIEVAAAYRLIALFGMDDIIHTHISAAVPGQAGQFLINPYGYMFSEITASCLVKVDVGGNVIDDPTGLGINPAGFTIHSAIHAARREMECVLHTHTRAGVAVSSLRDGLLPINQWALQFFERVSYHDYEAIALDLDERARIVRDMGDKKILIMRNHGLLTAGRSVGEAFKLMYNLNRSCEAQMMILASGAQYVVPPHEICTQTAAQYDAFYDQIASGEVADTEWIALVRRLRKLQPEFEH